MARIRNIINITNHPLYPNITRKAQVRQSKNDYETGIVEMVLNIYSYLDGAEIKEMFRQVYLIADDTMIDPSNFDVVEKDEEGNYPPGSVIQYDFLFDLVASKTKTQIELEEMYVLIKLPEIDKKLYNL